MSQVALGAVKHRFASEILNDHDLHGDETVIIKRDRWREIAEFLKAEPTLDFDMLVDITAVDYMMQGLDPRFEVVYHFYSTTLKHRLRVKIPLDEDELVVTSILELWGSADWMEREVWDMYGIKFDGHPDLRRILLYPEFVGHPLRKDYPMARRQPLVRREEAGGIFDSKLLQAGPLAGTSEKEL